MSNSSAQDGCKLQANNDGLSVASCRVKNEKSKLKEKGLELAQQNGSTTKGCRLCPNCQTLFKDEKSAASNDGAGAEGSDVNESKSISSRISSKSKGTRSRSEYEKKSQKEDDAVAEKKPKLDDNESCKRGKIQTESIQWFPPHINQDPQKHPLIPFPHPPARVELRAGHLMYMCMCLKRNGLQSDCPHTGCQGNKECLFPLLPACIPSGLALPPAKESFFQKADDPDCYGKTDVVKEMAQQVLAAKEATKEVEKVASISGLSFVPEETKKAATIRPNSPPNYISDPPKTPYLAPCRRHAKHGIPGSGKYDKPRPMPKNVQSLKGGLQKKGCPSKSV